MSSMLAQEWFSSLLRENHSLSELQKPLEPSKIAEIMLHMCTLYANSGFLLSFTLELALKNKEAFVLQSVTLTAKTR